MKVIKTASGKKTIKMSKREWEGIGKTAGWMKTADDYEDVKREYDLENKWDIEGDVKTTLEQYKKGVPMSEIKDPINGKQPQFAKHLLGDYDREIFMDINELKAYRGDDPEEFKFFLEEQQIFKQRLDSLAKDYIENPDEYGYEFTQGSFEDAIEVAKADAHEMKHRDYNKNYPI